jgi:hypothetical protein
MLSAIVDFSIIIANLGGVLGLSGLLMLNYVLPTAAEGCPAWDQATIPDPGRAWRYCRRGSAYPKRRSDSARCLGLRSFLSATFVARNLFWAWQHQDAGDPRLRIMAIEASRAPAGQPR